MSPQQAHDLVRQECEKRGIRWGARTLDGMRDEDKDCGGWRLWGGLALNGRSTAAIYDPFTRTTSGYRSLPHKNAD